MPRVENVLLMRQAEYNFSLNLPRANTFPKPSNCSGFLVAAALTLAGLKVEEQPCNTH